MQPTLEQFLAGQPLEFKSLEGHDRVATYKTDESAPYMLFTYPTGRRIWAPIMAEWEAINFYNDAATSSQAVAA